jgi:hypothetical protein
LLENLDRFLKRTVELKKSDPADAFADFQDSLDLIKSDFLLVKEMLNELTITSSKL